LVNVIFANIKYARYASHSVTVVESINAIYAPLYAIIVFHAYARIVNAHAWRMACKIKGSELINFIKIYI
jgi:hypothetical protein